jgi:hypothetical protein
VATAFSATLSIQGGGAAIIPIFQMSTSRLRVTVACQTVAQPGFEPWQLTSRAQTLLGVEQLVTN